MKRFKTLTRCLLLMSVPLLSQLPVQSSAGTRTLGFVLMTLLYLLFRLRASGSERALDERRESDVYMNCSVKRKKTGLPAKGACFA